MDEKKDCVSLLKEILRRESEDKSNTKRLPSGAQPTFWMFTLPEVPKDDCNKVYTNIFIGNKSGAQNKPLLKELKISHVVNAAQGNRFNQIPTSQEFYSDVNIEFLGFPAQDVSKYQLNKHFEDSSEFIDKALTSGGRVYVHCMQGVSRSATLVIAYLMMKQHMTVIEAVTEVRRKRPIFPNDGFLLQLCALNEELYGLVQP